MILQGLTVLLNFMVAELDFCSKSFNIAKEFGLGFADFPQWGHPAPKLQGCLSYFGFADFPQYSKISVSANTVLKDFGLADFPQWDHPPPSSNSYKFDENKKNELRILEAG